MSSGGTYLRLETTGRKTGLPHIVELRFAWLDGSFYVLGNSAASDWVLNVRGSGRARVRLGEYLYDVSAQKASETAADACRKAFEGKYGARMVSQWYARPGVCLKLTPSGQPVRRGSATGEQEAKTNFIQWSSTARNYYDEVAGAFDSASEEYDFTINRNFINTWIRRRSLQVLRGLVSPQDYLLEIGCGTGAEALEVVRWVAGIVAIDVSDKMIELLEAKVRARGLTGRVFPMKFPASEIMQLGDIIKGKPIRVAYSFNGALNCEPKLDHFAQELHALLEPEGYFVCSIRNTICASEMLSHAFVLQFDRATPRKKQPVMVSVGGKDIPSTYYSPSSFLDHFRPYFRAEEVIALPSLLPPAYLNEYYLRLRMGSTFLERLDKLVSGAFPFNRFGDQTLFVLRSSRHET